MTVFDPRTPSIARVYDYLLGGKDNFAADRAVAEKLLAVYPPVIETVPESRRFVERAVTWVAGQGITQFIDLGAGRVTRRGYPPSGPPPSDASRCRCVGSLGRVRYGGDGLVGRAPRRGGR